MPRVSSSGGGGRFRIDGVYAVLLRKQCVSGADARSVLFSDGTVYRRELVEREAAFEERLAAGEPFEVARWYLGGRSVPREDSWPAWLQPGSEVRSVRVYPNDTIQPVYDELSEAAG